MHAVSLERNKIKKRKKKPVRAKPLWIEVNSSATEHVLHGKRAFEEFKLVVNLTEQVRQQGADQVVFRGLLDRLRMGETVRNDWNILQQRMISPNTNAERARLDRSVHIQANLNDVKKANAEKLHRLAIS
jgi:hypothetical protein